MDEVKRHFESEARDFDHIIMTLIPDYARMLETLIAALPFERTEVIHAIDLGCGTGTLARAILDTFPNAFVTCVDVAENMIAMAQSKLGHHVHVKYIVADFEAFEFEENYDAVISFSSAAPFANRRRQTALLSPNLQKS
jgi:tRNA (cmo5U34)-methyltransferase